MATQEGRPHWQWKLSGFSNHFHTAGDRSRGPGRSAGFSSGAEP